MIFFDPFFFVLQKLKPSILLIVIIAAVWFILRRKKKPAERQDSPEILKKDGKTGAAHNQGRLPADEEPLLLDEEVVDGLSASRYSMKCPQCGIVITSVSRRCQCGYTYPDHSYEQLALLFGQKEALKELAPAISNLNTKLHEATERIRILESSLAGSFEAQQVPLHPQVQTGAPLTEQDFVFSKVDEKAAPPPLETKRPEAAEQTASYPLMEIKIGQKWMLIIGIIIMVFGVGYFLKYSFDQGWVGPAGRVTMAYIWGAAMLGASSYFKKTGQEMFGLFLIGGGVATLYFSTFAAFQIYHLFDQTPSFLIMVVITTFACVLAVHHDTKWLALLGLLGGFLTPVLISTGQDNQIVLMSYMTILNAGLLGIAFYKNWELLNLSGFAATYILYFGWFFRHYDQQKFWPAIIFLNIFYLIYSLVPLAYQIKQDRPDDMKGFAIITPNTFICFGLSYFMIRDKYSLEWVSVITIFYALTSLLAADCIRRRCKAAEQALVIFFGQAALFLILTIPIIFSKHVITIFWAIQALVLIWMGIKLHRQSIVAAACGLLFVTTAKLLFYDYPLVFELGSGTRFLAFRRPYLHMLPERYLTATTLIFALWRASSMLATGDSELLLLRKTDLQAIRGTLLFTLFAIVNIEAAAYFNECLPNATFAAISVLWAIFSIVIMILGFKFSNSILRKISLSLFALTVLKVMLIDMAHVSTPYRIVSFIILGLFLVGGSYMYHKFKDRILEAMTDRQEHS